MRTKLETITIPLIAILAWISLMYTQTLVPSTLQEERGSSDYSMFLYLFGILAAKSDWLNYLTVLASLPQTFTFTHRTFTKLLSTL